VSMKHRKTFARPRLIDKALKLDCSQGKAICSQGMGVPQRHWCYLYLTPRCWLVGKTQLVSKSGQNSVPPMCSFRLKLGNLNYDATMKTSVTLYFDATRG
jgi:hypothetical protein